MSKPLRSLGFRTRTDHLNRLDVFLIVLTIFVFAIHGADKLQAQAIAPDESELFIERSKSEQRRIKKETKAALTVDKPLNEDLNVKAPNVHFLKETNEVHGDGGLLVTRGAIKAQADEGTVNLTTKDAKLKGNVLVSSPGGTVGADRADVNFEDETGEFFDAHAALDIGGYDVKAGRIVKLSEYDYQVFDAYFSTCHCQDGRLPWSLKSRETHITQEGYANSYGTTFRVYDTPIMYFPYLGFPAKSERASGLLIPGLGFSNKDGFRYQQPLFLVIDDSTDATVSPFIETRTREGSMFDARRAYSKDHSAQGRLIYSDESRRGEDLRGTIVSDLESPTIDTNRFGGYYREDWRSKSDAAIPVGLFTDLHYVSDDLFSREIDDRDIVGRHDRFATSSSLLSATFGGIVTTELSGEYNKLIAVTPDEQVRNVTQEQQLQRLPEFDVRMLQSYRPFGFNPYGIKLSNRSRASLVDFVRSDGYDGWRGDFNPSFNVPMHYQNFVSSTLQVGMHDTGYWLRDTTNPGVTSELEDDTYQRRVYNVGYGATTALERVYELDPGGTLPYLAALGSENQDLRLVRVKNTIEPFAVYNFVPPTSQSGNPFFDSLDRIRARSVMTYGITSRLFGRFLPPRENTDDIVELSPRLENMPIYDLSRPLSDVGTYDEGPILGENVNLRKGEVRELVTFSLTQSYDFRHEQQAFPGSIDHRALTGVTGSFWLNPTRTFSLGYDTTYDVIEHNVNEWGSSVYFRDDRGDALRSRYSFTENSISQIESNLELALNERFRVGSYGRYDFVQHQSGLMEGALLFRYVGACNCWSIDVGVEDRDNPNKRFFLLGFTLRGLGEATQSTLYHQSREE